MVIILELLDLFRFQYVILAQNDKQLANVVLLDKRVICLELVNYLLLNMNQPQIALNFTVNLAFLEIWVHRLSADALIPL